MTEAQSISIHALLAESDLIIMLYDTSSLIFLSTLSLRRATNDAINGCNPDFISIHALLAESDPPGFHIFRWSKDFYPRSPCGERQRSFFKRLFGIHISIHALLAESDFQLDVMITTFYYFYPRSPCGERLPSSASLSP